MRINSVGSVSHSSTVAQGVAAATPLAENADAVRSRPLSFFDACLHAGKIDENGDWIGDEQDSLPALNGQELKKIQKFLSRSLRFRSLKLSSLKRTSKQRIESLLNKLTELCQKKDIPVPFTIKDDELSLNIDFSLKDKYTKLKGDCNGKIKKICIVGGSVPSFLGSAWYARTFEGADPSHFSHIDARIAVDYDQTIKVDEEVDVEFVSRELENYFITLAFPSGADQDVKEIFGSLLRRCFLRDGGVFFDQGYAHLWGFEDEKGNGYDISIVYKRPRGRFFHLHDLNLNITSLVDDNTAQVVPESDYKKGWQAAFDLAARVLNSDDLENRPPYDWFRYLSFVTRGNYCRKKEVEEGFAALSKTLSVEQAFSLTKKTVGKHHFKHPLALVAFAYNFAVFNGEDFTPQQKREYWEFVLGIIPKGISPHPLLQMAELLGKGTLTFDEVDVLLSVAAYGHLSLFGSGDSVNISLNSIHPFPTIVIRDKKQSSIIQLGRGIDEAMARASLLQDNPDAVRLLASFQREFIASSHTHNSFTFEIDSNADISAWMDDPSSLMFSLHYGLILSSTMSVENKRKILIRAMPDILCRMTDEAKRKCLLDGIREQTGLRCSFKKISKASSNVTDLSLAMVLDLCEGDIADFDLAFSCWKENKHLISENCHSARLLFKKAISLGLEKVIKVAEEMVKKERGSSEETIQMFVEIVNVFPIDSWSPVETMHCMMLLYSIIDKGTHTNASKILFKTFIHPLIVKINNHYDEETAYLLLVKAVEKQVLVKGDVNFQKSAAHCCEKALYREGGGVDIAANIWKKIERMAKISSYFVPFSCMELMIVIAEKAAAQKLFCLSDEFLGRVNESSCENALKIRYKILVKDRLERLKALGQTIDIEELLNSNRTTQFTDEESIGYRVNIGNVALAKGDVKSSCKLMLKMLEMYTEIEDLSIAAKADYKAFVCALVDKLLVSDGDKDAMQWRVSQLKIAMISSSFTSLFTIEELFSIKMRCLSVASTMGQNADQHFIDACVIYLSENLPANPQIECDFARMLVDIYGIKRKDVSDIDAQFFQQMSPRLVFAAAKLKDVNLLVDYLIMLNSKKIAITLGKEVLSCFCLCSFQDADARKVCLMLKSSNIFQYLPDMMKTEVFRSFMFAFVNNMIGKNLESYIAFIYMFIDASVDNPSRDYASTLIEQAFIACNMLIQSGNLNSSLKIHDKLWSAIEKENDFLYAFTIANITVRPRYSLSVRTATSRAITFMKRLASVHNTLTHQYIDVARNLCVASMEKNDVRQCLNVIRHINEKIPSCKEDPLWIENLEDILFYLYVSEGYHSELLELIAYCPELTVEDWILLFEKFKKSSQSMHDKIIDKVIELEAPVEEEEQLAGEWADGFLEIAAKSSLKTQERVLEIFAINIPIMAYLQNASIYRKICCLIVAIQKSHSNSSVLPSLIRLIDAEYLSQSYLKALSVTECLSFFTIYLYGGDPALMLLGMRRLIESFKKNRDLQGDLYVNYIEKYVSTFNKLDADAVTVASFIVSFKSCIDATLDSICDNSLSLKTMCGIANIGIDYYPEALKKEIFRVFDYTANRCSLNHHLISASQIEKFFNFAVEYHADIYYSFSKIMIVGDIFSLEQRELALEKFFIASLDEVTKSEDCENIREALFTFTLNIHNIEINKSSMDKCMKAAFTTVAALSRFDSVGAEEILGYCTKFFDLYVRFVTKKFEEPISVFTYKIQPDNSLSQSAATVTLDQHVEEATLKRLQSQYFSYMEFFIQEMLKAEKISGTSAIQHLEIVFTILNRLLERCSLAKEGVRNKRTEISRLIYSVFYSGLYFSEKGVFENFRCKAVKLMDECAYKQIFSSHSKELYACTLMVSSTPCISLMKQEGVLIEQYHFLFKHLKDLNSEMAIEHLLFIMFHRDERDFLAKYPDLGKRMILNLLDIITEKLEGNTQNSLTYETSLLFKTTESIIKDDDSIYYDDGTPAGRERSREILLKYLAVSSSLYLKVDSQIGNTIPWSENPISGTVNIVSKNLSSGLFDDSPDDYFSCLYEIHEGLIERLMSDTDQNFYLTMESMIFKKFTGNNFSYKQQDVVLRILLAMFAGHGALGWVYAKKIFDKMMDFERLGSANNFFICYESYIEFLTSIFGYAIVPLAVFKERYTLQEREMINDFITQLLLTDLPNILPLTLHLKEKRAQAFLIWIKIYLCRMSGDASDLLNMADKVLDKAHSHNIFEECPHVLSELAGLLE